jgi:hypothetical protein
MIAIKLLHLVYRLEYQECSKCQTKMNADCFKFVLKLQLKFWKNILTILKGVKRLQIIVSRVKYLDHICTNALQ